MSNGRITVELNGVMKTLRFNNYGKEELVSLYGAKHDALLFTQMFTAELQSNMYRAFRKLIYAGLVGDYEALMKDIDFTIEDVSLWIENMPEAEFEKILNCYVENNKPVTLPEFSKDGDKKKEEDAQNP